jgi:ABC-type amino acid transport substrate-binding protein
MNTLRVVLIASVAAVAAACSSTPSKPAAAPVAAAPVVPTLAGNWTVTIESQMGSQDSKLTLAQTGKDLSGKLEAPPPVGSADIKGDVVGADVKMWFMVNAQGMELKIDLVGTQENGSTMKGRAVFGTFGEGTFTAKKNP